MRITTQIRQSLLDAPFALRHIRMRSAVWMLLYLLVGTAIFALFTWQLLDHEQAIKELILDYLFPKSWQSLSEQLLLYFYSTQAKIVIGNMILGASLVLASVFLFPIKEAFSARFEQDAGYPNGNSQEFPLWLQAIEESRLLLFYLSAQVLILWIGYYPFTATQWISIGLSYLFLFFTFGLDFISPTLQRHRIKYELIIKVLLKRPFLVLSYGALFSLPAIVIARYLFADQAFSLVEVTGLLFLINMIFLTLSIPAGTHVASQILPEIRQSRALSKTVMNWSYAVIALILCAGLYLHASLFKSLHHKSQLLKAHYSFDFNSIDYQLPSFDELLNGEALSNFAVDLEIYNPTEFDIVIENSQILIDKQQQNIAQVDLSGFEIPAGQTRRVQLKLDSSTQLGKLRLEQLKDLNTLLDDWRVDMHIQIWPGIPFIMNIYRPD